MRVTISDHTEGSGPFRKEQLESRVRRAFLAYSTQIDSVELQLSQLGLLQLGVLLLKIQGGMRILLRTKGRRHSYVVDNLLELGDSRLYSLFRKGRVCNEAV